MRERIQTQIDLYGKIGHPALMERFIIRNGRAYTPAPYDGTRLTAKECFSNSTTLSMINDSTYVEGFAYRKTLGLLIHHAWTVEGDTVVDPTWDEPENSEYFGVPFDRRVLHTELMRLGYYGILDTQIGINLDFMLRIDPGLAEFIPK